MKPEDKPLASRAVTVYFRKKASGAMLLKQNQLDADGQTLSVIGPKSLVPGSTAGDEVVVRLSNGGLVVGKITHIHRTSDTYRAEVTTSDVNRAGGSVPPPVSSAKPSGGLVWKSRGPTTTRRG